MTEATHTIAGVLIDPDQRTVTAVRVPVYPPNPEEAAWCTNTISFRDIYPLLGCEHIGAFTMPGCKQDNCYYNDDYLEADGKQVGFFQLGSNWNPVPGRMLIVGFEFEKHAYHDATTTVAEVESKVIWTRRITRGYTSEPFEHAFGFGIRIDRVAPIVEEK